MRPAIVGLVALLSAGVLVSCSGSGQPDKTAAQAYLDAYAAGNAAQAAGHTTDAAAATAALTATLQGLSGTTRSFRIGTVANRTATTSTVNYSATWKFPAAKFPAVATWSYSGSLAMTKSGSSWQVQWSPTDVEPALSDGQHLVTKRTQPTRAELLDSSGQPLFTPTPVVTVGIDPTKVTDLPSLAAALAAIPQLSSTAAEIIQAVTQAGTNYAPIITLRKEVYDQIKAQIYSLPGTAFHQSTELLGPTSTFAQPLLGRVAAATKAQIDASKGTIATGDMVGQGGLQEALNSQLAGTAGLSVQAVDAGGTVVKSIAALSSPVPGKPVTLTLDRATQTAAEQTLAGIAAPAAIVVTQPSTGKIRAVAQTPAAIAQGDLALTGQFPPGSIFKIVTYTAAFTTNPALSPQTTADCPGTFVYNGQTIRNENDFAKGVIPLSSAFAYSCNTTAANVALQLPTGALAKAANSLGLGQQWKLPVAAFAGSMPAAAASNELAAEGYGQGKTLVSPLLMAEIVGGAATGTAIAPSIVDNQPGSRLPAQPPQVTGYLNTMMRDVITVPGATGNALADLPGPVEGKTGTAEFGGAGQSHAWFVGTRGDVAFSVFIYGGGNSTDISVPTTRTLLRNLP